MTSPQSQTRSHFQLPSSITLLLAPGIRGHTLIFLTMMSVLSGAAYLSRGSGSNNGWTVMFALGASATATYLALVPLVLFEKARKLLLFSRMKTRVILLAIIYFPIFAGVLYSTLQAGSAQALPVFPVFVAIFYGWALLQAYFIATPVSQFLTRIEDNLSGEGHVKKFLRTIGTVVLFLPVVPLGLGVWEISSWSTQNYQNIPGAGDKILAWAMIVTLVLVATYVLNVVWGWRSIRQGRPQSAIFAGGTFLLLWGYLLYRATALLMAYVAQSQPSSALIDTGIMIVSIVGAIQTFARKTMRHADSRWSQVLPFLVFSFGSAYAVAQFYFILQAGLTQSDVSIVVNAIVFSSGILLLMLLLRRHLISPRAYVPTLTSRAQSSVPNAETEAPNDAEKLALGDVEPRENEEEHS